MNLVVFVTFVWITLFSFAGNAHSGSHAAAQPIHRVRVKLGPTDSRILSVTLEDYLVGVVLREMDAGRFPEAALQAQAIAARTYAIAKVQQARARGDSFDVDASVLDQVFLPANSSESAPAARAKLAVEHTQGQVLVDRRTGRIFLPFYHSTCGGRTELPEAVWGKKADQAYQRRVCELCADSPRFRWQSLVTEKDLVQRLELAPGERIAEWQRVGSSGGRVRQMRAKTSLGRALTFTGQEWRAKLGFDVLRSLWLDAPIAKGRDWVFRGRGAGHGVGMCQWGARGGAVQGWSAEKILQNYYPFARVVHLNQARIQTDL